MKLLTQIFLTSLIVLKILLASIFVYQVEFAPFFPVASAIASEEQNSSRRNAKESGSTVAEREVDINHKLRGRTEFLEEVKRLEKKKAELLAIQAEITDKIARLTQLRDEIRSEIAKKEGMKAQRLKHLIKVYSTMKPQKAADLIEKLNLALAIELLSKMKGDAVGNILSFVDPEKAAKISEGLVKRK